MKKLLMALVCLPLSIFCSSQNIFPANGNVGIGTTNPQGTLQIKGPQLWDASTVFRITNNAAAYGRTNLVLTGRFQNSNDAWEFGSAARNSVVFAQNETDEIGAIGSEKYSIQLEGNSKALGFLSLQNGNTPNLLLAQNGNVGIGAASPQTSLDISGRNNPEVRLRSNKEDDNWGLRIGQKEDLNSYMVASGRNLRIEGGWSSVLQLGCEEMNQYGGKVVIPGGNVGIGTTSPSEKLSVNGNIRAKKVLVTQTGWPDYVFDQSYQLPSLDSVHNFIKENKHLPEMPSAALVEKDGCDVGEVQKLLLKKVEELTLYVIELKKENKEMKEENKRQQKEIEELMK